MPDVPVFFDKTELEQVQELRVFFKSKVSPVDDASSKDIIPLLSSVIDVCSSCWSNTSISDVNLEGVFNSIISLLYVMPLPQSTGIIETFCDQITEVVSDKRHMMRLKLLNNLLNSLDDSANMVNCYPVYLSMVKLAGEHNLMGSLNPAADDMRAFFTRWNTPVPKQRLLLSTVHQSLIKCHMTESATLIMLELLSTYNDDDATVAKNDAVICVKTSIMDPNTFIMDNLLSLKPVQCLKGELIYDLLNVFVSGKLADYVRFVENNPKVNEKYGLDHMQNLQKMKHLSFMDMCEDNRKIFFSDIQDKLNITLDEIESLVIDVFRTKMVRGKIDYCNKCVKITNSCRRSFEFDQWNSLKNQLLVWKQNLTTVINNTNTVIENPA